MGPNTPLGPGCLAFAATGYQICGAFATFWQANGGLQRFGLPVTGAYTATLDNTTYTVQYFERQRFELHPEVAPDTVLLGLLGHEIYTARHAPPPPTPKPLPPSYNGCVPDVNAGQAPNYPIMISAIDKLAETVTLHNVSSATVNLEGWVLCSIRGSQQHPIGGPLVPDDSKVFPGTAGNIWSNTSPDPGALYDPQGRLVSYWPD